jgi:hypothetical protein
MQLTPTRVKIHIKSMLMEGFVIVLPRPPPGPELENLFRGSHAINQGEV